MIVYKVIFYRILSLILILGTTSYVSPIISANMENRQADITANVAFAETAVFEVSNTNNSGAGSLRQAILDANANPGFDSISFNIPGVGTHTINLTSALPNISQPLMIDGTSEPDFINIPVVRIDGDLVGDDNGLIFTSVSDSSTIRGLMITRFNRNGIKINSGADGITITGNWIGSTGNGSILVGNNNNGINVQGANTIIGGTGDYDQNVITNNGNEGINITGTGATGTQIRGNIIGLDPDGSTGSGNMDVGIALLTGSDSTVIGGPSVAERNIISMNYEGIEINSKNNVVQGNYIGTDVSGTFDRGNRSDDGVEINNNATGNLIGGTVPEAMNVISANAQDGIKLNGPSNTILGNIIGLDASGTLDLGNEQYGIRVAAVADNIIGGTTVSSSNVISANNIVGILLAGSTGTLIQGNYIGTDITGSIDMGNGSAGLMFDSNASGNTIGGVVEGAGNTIAFNSGDGIWISTNAGSNNTILRNSIYSNSGIGIDLLNEQVTANDIGDVDTGPNDLQNYPHLENVTVSGGSTTITGTLNSTADTPFRIEFFSSPTGDATGYGEGQSYVGFTTVTTDGSGDANIDTTLTGVAVTLGHVVTTTATVDLGNGNYGNTSEFGANVIASLNQADFDNPCIAAELSVNQGCSFEIFNNADATDSGIPLAECEGYSGGDIWFKVEVPVSGNLIVTVDSGVTPEIPNPGDWLSRPGLAVYSGSCNNLTHDTCWIDPSSEAPFLMPEISLTGYTPGDSLFLRVWGYNDSTGFFKICARHPDIEIFNLSGSGSYCEGGAGLAVSLNGSQPGMDYQLKKNGIDHGAPLSGNGNSLLWSDQSGGVYDVVAINISAGLTKRMNGKAIIIENPIPVVTYGYENYKTISINSDSVDSPQDLVNFPLLVSIPDDPDLRTLENGGYVYNNNGFDIAFTDKDFNPLPFEMISYDPVTGAYAGWVKVPLVSYNMDTDIQMLYGKSGISTDHSSRETWNAEYVQVMHLDENFEDATLSGNYGLNDGSTDAIGRLGNGRSFDGLDDKIIVYDDPALDGTNDEATFSLWINFVDASDGDHQIILTTENRYSGAGYEWASQGPGNHFFYPNGNDNDNYNMVANPFVDGAWHYLVTTFNFSTLEVKFYVDGIPVTLIEENVPVYWSALGDLDNWLWGGNPDRNSRYFYGLMDEIRIQTVARQEGWFRTEYANQNNPTGFYSISEGNKFEPFTDLCLDVDPFALPQPKPLGGILSGTGVDGNYFDPGAAGAGDHTITYTYTDGNGCLASGSKVQTVLSVPSPTITGNISVCPNSSGETYSTPAVAGHSYAWVITGSGASIIGGQGTNEIIVDWDTISGTVSVSETNDASGCDSTTADLIISVGDNISPVFECPADLTEYLDLNCEFSIPDYSGLINLSDDCDPDPSYIQSPAQGTVLSGSGTFQEVVLTSNDAHGNESTCSFNLLILDNTPPEAISLSDTSVIIPEGVFKTSIDMPLPVFADNCGVLSVSNDFNGGTDASGIYSYGTTTVVYTVTDINNNTATFNQQVVVELENEPEHGLIITEAFSPNEDGFNDRFEILGLEQYSENELKVYNVHGIEVFTMSNYDNSWDGMARSGFGDNSKLPTGTYYYILNLNSEENFVKGFIYLKQE